MNSGVKLVAGDEQQIIDSVNKLIEKGTEVLVCGTCLDFYGLKEQLKVGEVSNMYDIGPYARTCKTLRCKGAPCHTSYVMAFESTHAAMASEAALGAAHAHAAMIPTPRAISAGCGMSMRFDAEDDAAAGMLARVCVDARGLSALYREMSKTEFELLEKL